VSLLEAHDLQFSYVPERPVVASASLSLEKSAIAAIIGSNGCGKSTLIRLLAGLIQPQSGEVLYRGVPLTRIDRKQFARNVAYVPQNTSRAFPFTALEVVLTGRSPHVSRFRLEDSVDVEKALNALEIVGVAHLAHRRVTELSGGERQLVSVARALAQEPSCVLLDEPSSSLDLKHRAGLIRTLSNLRTRAGLTVLMVTHDLTLLDPGFDMVFAMRCGAIAALGKPSEVLRNSVLANIYDDVHIRARRVDGRTSVWSEIQP
jgi:iron complex transport system ATP-binding protein